MAGERLENRTEADWLQLVAQLTRAHVWTWAALGAYALGAILRLFAGDVHADAMTVAAVALTAPAAWMSYRAGR